MVLDWDWDQVGSMLGWYYDNIGLVLGWYWGDIKERLEGNMTGI